MAWFRFGSGLSWAWFRCGSGWARCWFVRGSYLVYADSRMFSRGSCLVRVRLVRGSCIARVWFVYGSYVVQVWFTSRFAWFMCGSGLVQDTSTSVVQACTLGANAHQYRELDAHRSREQVLGLLGSGMVQFGL